MLIQHLPQSTPYDPAEDPPGSVDPLGTAAGAEQLAELLLPDLTARMWRVRLLTFAALAAEVAKRAAVGREDRLVDARLAFERLFVSAIVRQEQEDSTWRQASRRLPGVGLARQALYAGDQPLERANFLKGQAVNGPVGVISRLARRAGVIDEAGHLASSGTDLLHEWAEDQELPGLLDEGTGRDGANWMQKQVKQVTSCLDERIWPSKGWFGWADLSERLRPDRPGPRERKVLKKLLANDPLGLRDRVIRTMADPAFVSIYRDASPLSFRGRIEQEVLVKGFDNAGAEDEVGRTLRASVQMIDAYEQLSGLLESAFRGILWALTHSNGQAPRDSVLQDVVLRPFLDKIRSGIEPTAKRFQRCLQAIEQDRLVLERASVNFDRMQQLLDDSFAAAADNDACASAVMDRHVRVQREKNKGLWIEEDDTWTLMPGFGDSADEPPSYGGYLHPYRITNFYGMLADLKIVPKVKGYDGAEEIA